MNPLEVCLQSESRALKTLLGVHGAYYLVTGVVAAREYAHP